MFDEGKALRKKGKRPVIRLTAAARVVKPVRGRGRPPKWPPGTPMPLRYRGLRGKGKPRCLAKGCTKTLRMHQEAACSDVCENRIINDALWRLKQCKVSLDRLIELYKD
jgi:hypothetical protein